MVRTLDHDDVVFMYTPKDAEPLIEYRASFIAWGGAHKAAKVKELHELGIHCTGTMWCLTAGAETIHENADASFPTVILPTALLLLKCRQRLSFSIHLQLGYQH
jgi:hypothetical protein